MVSSRLTPPRIAGWAPLRAVARCGTAIWRTHGRGLISLSYQVRDATRRSDARSAYGAAAARATERFERDGNDASLDIGYQR